MTISASHTLEIQTYSIFRFIIIFIITQNITKSSPSLSKPYEVSFPSSRNVPKTCLFSLLQQILPGSRRSLAIAPVMAKTKSKCASGSKIIRKKLEQKMKINRKKNEQNEMPFFSSQTNGYKSAKKSLFYSFSVPISILD